MLYTLYFLIFFESAVHVMDGHCQYNVLEFFEGLSFKHFHLYSFLTYLQPAYLLSKGGFYLRKYINFGPIANKRLQI